MKRSVLMVLLLAAVAAMAGCGGEVKAPQAPEFEKTITVSSPSVSDVLEERTAAEASTEENMEDAAIASTEESAKDAVTDEKIVESANASAATSLIQQAPLPDPEAEKEQDLSNVEGVDIDLTALSSTVVYAQVYNMMYYPENFVGKTIRMEGIFTDYLDMAKGKHYFACFIQDATACCSQGVEFEPVETYAYPDDYPKEGDTVVVEGVFDVYHEDGYEYCTLRKAEMLSIEPGV